MSMKSSIIYQFYDWQIDLNSPTKYGKFHLERECFFYPK